MAVFQGNKSPALNNYWTVTVTVNRASGGNFQYWANRVWNLASYGLLFPVTGTVGLFSDPTI